MDVIGVLDNVEEAGQIQRRDGSSAEKRNLTLRDDSNKAIDITLWGDKAANPGNELEAVSPPPPPPSPHSRHPFLLLVIAAVRHMLSWLSAGLRCKLPVPPARLELLLLMQIFRRGDHPIVGMKSLKVGDFNGKTLSTLGSSVIQIDPQHPRTQQLRSWSGHLLLWAKTLICQSLALQLPTLACTYGSTSLDTEARNSCFRPAN